MPGKKSKASFDAFVTERIKAPFGRRRDGTPKGTGFLGELQRPDGRVSTELSVGIEMDGEEVDVPALVPTLTRKEVMFLVNDFKPGKDKIPRGIVRKARDHAVARRKAGISAFRDDAGIQNRKKGRKFVPGETGISPVPN